jgi:hypothetical protein
MSTFKTGRKTSGEPTVELGLAAEPPVYVDVEVIVSKSAKFYTKCTIFENLGDLGNSTTSVAYANSPADRF